MRRINSPLKKNNTCGQFWVGAGENTEESLKLLNAMMFNDVANQILSNLHLIENQNKYAYDVETSDL